MNNYSLDFRPHHLACFLIHSVGQFSSQQCLMYKVLSGLMIHVCMCVCFKICFYLFENQSYRKREGGTEKNRQRERSFIYWFSPQVSVQQLVLSQAKARSWDLLLGLSHVCRGSSICAIICGFPECIIKQLDQNGATGSRTSAHMGACPAGSSLTHDATVPAP